MNALNQGQRWVVVAGMALLALNLAFPPWFHITRLGEEKEIVHLGYSLVFRPAKRGHWAGEEMVERHYEFMDEAIEMLRKFPGELQELQKYQDHLWAHHERFEEEFSKSIDEPPMQVSWGVRIDIRQLWVQCAVIVAATVTAVLALPLLPLLRRSAHRKSRLANPGKPDSKGDSKGGSTGANGEYGIKVIPGQDWPEQPPKP